MDFLQFFGEGLALATLASHVQPEDVFVADSVGFPGVDTARLGMDDHSIATLAALVAATGFVHGTKVGSSHRLDDIEAEEGQVRGSWVGAFSTNLSLPKELFLRGSSTDRAPSSVGEAFARVQMPAVLLGRSDRFDAMLAENAPNIADSDVDVFGTEGAATLTAAVTLSRLYGGWDKVPLQHGHTLFLVAAAGDRPDLIVTQGTFLRTA